MMPIPAAVLWRSAENVVDFCECFELPKEFESRITDAISHMPANKSFRSKMLALMQEFFGIAIIMLKKETKLDLSYLQRKDDDDDDDDEYDDHLMSIYAECMKKTNSHYWVSRYKDVVLDVLKGCLPKAPKSSRPPLIGDPITPYTRSKMAFDQPEQGRGGKMPSQTVWEIICQYHQEYIRSANLSPYTSLVGPSGIGKSFCMKSIASSGSAYVVYLSFADRRTDTYPSRWSEAWWFFQVQGVGGDGLDLDRAAATTKFECFLAANIWNVQLCRRFNITPIEYFDMQVKDGKVYKDFRAAVFISLQKLELTLYEEAKDRTLSEVATRDPQEMDIDPANSSFIPRRDFRSDEHGSDFDYGDYIRRKLPDMRESGMIPVPVQEAPSVVFAFDEAGALLRPRRPTDTAFLSLRRAMRHYNVMCKVVDESFFGVLLDTTSKFNPFAPPSDVDPSIMDLHSHRDHFPPIYMLDTFDVLVPKPRISEILGPVIDVKKLFSFGRPLWGSHLSLASERTVLDIARRKMYGTDSPHGLYGGGMVGQLSDLVLIGMLGYRVQFYVPSNHLAEKLVSGHLRMIYDISSDRMFMRTIQPSEPLLAWLSFTEMTQMKCKLAMINVFWNYCNLGSIDVGDIGEIVASLVLLFSFDKTQTSQLPRPQLLTVFFQSLFGQKFHDNGQEQREKYTEELKSLWDQGLVFFNHFTRLEEPLSEIVLRRAWTRGQALFTPVGTAYHDIAIPVALPDNNKISCILIQVKNRKADRMSSGLKVQARYGMEHAVESVDLLRGIQNDKGKIEKLGQPSIFMFMALRGRASKVDFSISNTAITPATRSATSRSRQMHHHVILASGLDENLYPGTISSNEDGSKVYDALRGLLDIKSVSRINETPYHKHLRGGVDD